MKPRAKYTVNYTRDRESKWWVAEVDSLQGCITQGRTIEQARTRIREALQAWFDLDAPFAGELVDEVALPAAVRKKVDEARDAAERSAKVETERSEKSRAAVHALVLFGFSFRDVGELLGLSRQRTQQLMPANEKGLARGKRAIGA